MTQQIAAYGFDEQPVFALEPLEDLGTLGELVDEGSFSELELVDQGDESTLGQAQDFTQPQDFLAEANARLNGQVSAVEGQALSTMNGWADDAKATLLANIQPDTQALIAQGANAFGQAFQALQGGISPQSIIAVTALAASSVGGPVAGAAVGSLFAGVNVLADSLLAVAKTLGIAASAPPIDAYCGWIDQTKGVQKPWGPSDPGNGTPSNPGWIDSWQWISKRFVKGTLPPVLGMPASVFWGLPGLQTGNNGCEASYSGPPEPLIAPLSPVDTGFQARLICEYLHARTIEDNGGPPQFETFFVPLVFANLDLGNNCSPIAALPLEALLPAAVQVWNAAHAPGTPRTIAAQTATQSLAYVPTIASILAGDYGGNSLPAITLNQGPAIPPPAAAAPGSAQPSGNATPVATAPGSAAAAPSSSSAAPIVATVVVGAGLGAAWWWLGKPLSVSAFKAAWREVAREFS